ncbi:hypothetical protein GALMADRAFT_139295 [Galerina marginata CBS 339.88]|uniref:Phosphatidylglycerol lysyltransferase C-terminal domain-containing protein n=1 Tax=Galerina marginata (strain CBS 339.88) TaxID=685588 RepID=A0A067T2C8_GALM3|nr:hypothetical protein GALMADRAFT_139295 [Galerina marginata CBS 339.88]
MAVPDKSSIAELVAKYGSSSATAWLEFERYKLWQPSEPVPESSFTPVQGYMEKDPYIFAWGNPLVSDPAALPSVARQFIQFCESQNKRAVWACVDRDLEEILGGPEFSWCTVSCIYEDVVDPAHVVDLTSPEAKGTEGQRVVKDLKKNLYRAEKYDVKVKEVLANEWTAEDKLAVEQGIEDWKDNKSGVQIASTTLQPWLDSEHRRYWLAKQSDKPVGILILAPIQASSWQIKNAVSFPSAPKGTSEALIYTALKDLHEQEEQAMAAGKKIPHPSNGYINEQTVQPTESARPPLNSASEASSASDLSISSLSSTSDGETSPATSQVDATSSTETGFSDKSHGHTPSRHKGEAPQPSKTHHRDENRVTVTFGISAAPDFQPIRNLGGWKVKALGKTYSKVASGAKLLQRGEFRSKFDSDHDPMYVCYPSDGFGLDGVNALLKVLKK